MKLFNFFKMKQVESATAPAITPYDVAHDLYCQMLRRPVTEHDEIAYTILRLYKPEYHIHKNPRKKAA